MKRLLLCLLIVCQAVAVVAQRSVDLSGEWRVRLDPEFVGESQGWGLSDLDGRIELPASLTERGLGDEVTAETRWTLSIYDSTYYYSPRMAKYRQKDNVKFPFFLTPLRHYEGAAWYGREVEVPSDWGDKRIRISFERPHGVTDLWVNGRKVGSQNSLSVPHVYDITEFVTVGAKSKIRLRMDNSSPMRSGINVGCDSHSVSDQTQGNWNGVVGRIEMSATPKSLTIKSVDVYPDIDARKAVVKVALDSDLVGEKALVKLRAKAFNTGKHHQTEVTRTFVLDRQNEFSLSLDMGADMLLWSEFSPALYNLEVEIELQDKPEQSQTYTTTFGMRKFEVRGKMFYINNRPIVLRGTVENCDFPLTGYAPMDVESWKRVFERCKEFGLNHMRYHSYCPPKAAFEAADLVGFYLQPECASWTNHGTSLGRGRAIDQYMMTESELIVAEYGNHASFCMFAAGNEPSGNWVPWATNFVEHWQAKDPTRRVYTGFSVGNSWTWQPRSQFHVKAGARGLAWDKERPHTLDTYSERIDTVSAPYVTHELGQWCAYPNFEEIPKYTGVKRAYNFEIFRDLLAENGMEGQGRDFVMASGALQNLCYKYETERAMRTPNYAGYQLLAINDYSGQGTAMVGLLDVFFDPKPYTEYMEEGLPKLRQTFNETVLLSRLPRFVWRGGETVRAELEVAHFGENKMSGAELNYKLASDSKLYAHGSISGLDVDFGACQEIGAVEFDLPNVTNPVKVTLSVNLNGRHDISNSWDMWIYPKEQSWSEEGVYVTDTLDSKALKVLKNGGRVLVEASGKVSYGKDIVQRFTPIFWNTSWFKMRPPHTMGILTDSDHKLFKNFPTENHSNLQWWELLNGAQVMQFTEFDKDFRPLVQSIDTWHVARKIGVLFEAQVGRGQLLMTTLDISSDLDERPVAQALRKSIFDYMLSPDFAPTQRVKPEQVSGLFTIDKPQKTYFTNDSPDELKNKIL